MKQLAKLSYVITLISIAILISWCIGSLIITTFNLKVFQENTSEFVTMAILPILATVAGAAMINIVSNVGVIANHISQAEESISSGKIRIGIKIFLVGNFALIASLFAGDRISTIINTKSILREISSVANENAVLFKKVDSVNLDINNVKEIHSILKYINKSTPILNNPSLIFPCKYKSQSVMCEIDGSAYSNEIEKIIGLRPDTGEASANIDTVQYLLNANQENRTLIKEILASNSDDPRVGNTKPDYVIYIPLRINKSRCILKMNKNNSYGYLGRK